MFNVREIIGSMDSPSDADVQLITKAFNFSRNAHKDQKRLSGEIYFVHLFETAKILATIKMGSKTISAGFLHDCIEDGKTDAITIEKEFGPEILFLINGVTKLDKILYDVSERYIGSLQKMFIAISQDLRVLIIKLADRLHNMRTLQYFRPEKRLRIAKETLELFVPLAYRLGIRKIGVELEDLSFFYVFQTEYEKVRKLMQEKIKRDLPILKDFMKDAEEKLNKENIFKISIYYRVKGLYSLFCKLPRKNNNIEEVYDTLAVRVIAESVADCYKILGIMHGAYRPLPGRIKDYIAVPKPNGYQGLHTTVFDKDDNIIEIQIRTREMNERSEYGVASYIYEKESCYEKCHSMNSLIKDFKHLSPQEVSVFQNQSSKVFNNNISSWIKELIKSDLDKDGNGNVDDDTKSDFFAVRMFTFTPKGDVVDLPINSTPIDFAYAIDVEVGNHLDYVKVNGKKTPLSTKLKSGDIVEVFTKNIKKPSSRWINIAKTVAAKRYIKEAFEKQTK